MLSEFREFIARGNVIDLAVGIIVGAAFTAIVNSIVNDLINPVLGLATAGINFNDLALTVGGASISYGKFITAVINFFLIAFVVFLIVKAVNSVKRAAERHAQREATAAAPAGPSEREILIEIRDALRALPAAPARPDA